MMDFLETFNALDELLGGSHWRILGLVPDPDLTGYIGECEPDDTPNIFPYMYLYQSNDDHSGYDGVALLPTDYVDEAGRKLFLKIECFE
jgi:hypothetical protein